MTMQTFTPIEYLMIDVASNFGLDKETWDTRLEWFNMNQNEIEKIAALGPDSRKEIQTNELMKQADSPTMFFAGIKAWDQARRGEAIGYPVSLDATASGAQLLAILIGCEQTAALCNVIDTGDREDLYTNVHKLICDRLGTQDSIVRADAKRATMTSLYGSTRQPRDVFGEGEKLEAFYKTMEEDLPGAWLLNEALIGLWQPHALSHDWLLPDNFHVKVKVMEPVNHPFQVAGKTFTATTYHNIGSESGLSLSANVVHSVDGLVVREISRRCSWDKTKMENLLQLLSSILTTGTYARGEHRSPNHDMVEKLWAHYTESGFLSARILELLDAENLHLVDVEIINKMVSTLPTEPFPVLAVHDCFRVHPNYANDLRKQYNQILHDLAQSDILAFIARRIAGPSIQVNKFGHSLASKVLEANYALS